MLFQIKKITVTKIKQDASMKTHLFGKVLLDYVVSEFVNVYVFMTLQSFNPIET